MWYKGKARIIRAKRRIFELADATVDWKDITDERRYNRSLVGDAVLMWSNREVVWAFRSLDEHAQLEIWRREVIRRFRLRFELRPAQRMLRIWLDWTDQQVGHSDCFPRQIIFLSCWRGMAPQTGKYSTFQSNIFAVQHPTYPLEHTELNTKAPLYSLCAVCALLLVRRFDCVSSLAGSRIVS